MKNKENMTSTENMLANLDRVMRQLRRRPQGNPHATRGTHRLLRIIAKNPGLSTKELTQMMDIRQASLNERLKRLEDEGLIQREKDVNDKRIQLIHLGSKAVDYLNSIQEIRSKTNDAISLVLTGEEIEVLTQLAGKLASGLEHIASNNKTNIDIKDKERRDADVK